MRGDRSLFAFLTGSSEIPNTKKVAEVDSSLYPQNGSLQGRVDEDEQCEDSGKYGVGTVYLGRAKSYPLGLWQINTSASTRIC